MARVTRRYIRLGRSLIIVTRRVEVKIPAGGGAFEFEKAKGWGRIFKQVVQRQAGQEIAVEDWARGELQVQTGEVRGEQGGRAKQEEIQDRCI